MRHQGQTISIGLTVFRGPNCGKPIGRELDAAPRVWRFAAGKPVTGLADVGAGIRAGQGRNSAAGDTHPDPVVDAAATPALRVAVGVSARGLGEGFHHQSGAAARNMGDDRGAAMQLGDGAEVDGEREHHLLAFTQTEVGGLDENTGRAQVDRLA